MQGALGRSPSGRMVSAPAPGNRIQFAGVLLLLLPSLLSLSRRQSARRSGRPLPMLRRLLLLLPRLQICAPPISSLPCSLSRSSSPAAVAPAIAFPPSLAVPASAQTHDCGESSYGVVAVHDIIFFIFVTHSAVE
jgi:hypothetical protein